MFLTTDALVQRLRELRPALAARYRVRELALFGSFARRSQGEESDIDLLVDFTQGADLFDLMGLALDLEEQFQRKVDLVPRRALRHELRDAVERELVPI